MDSDLETDTYSQLDERLHYFYGAIYMSPAIGSEKSRPRRPIRPGVQGQRWQSLRGGKTYRLRVPANVPVSAFSSQTLYETETRSMIQNPRNDSALSSYDTLKNDAVPANQLSFVIREGQQLHSLGRCEDFAARHRFGV